MHERKKNQYDELCHQNSAIFCHLMQKKWFRLSKFSKILKD